MSVKPYILFEDLQNGTQKAFTSPLAWVTCETPSQIESYFEKISSYQKQGYWLAGYLCYELGYYLDQSLAPPHQRPNPLFSFGVFEKPLNPQEIKSFSETLFTETSQKLSLSPLSSPQPYSTYKKKLSCIKAAIEKGETYQVNYTFILDFLWEHSIEELYTSLKGAQRASYAALLSFPSLKAASFSPELFFKKTGTNLTCQPMKGTIETGQTAEQDLKQRDILRNSPKDQAENVMIVDLLRNDMTKISTSGSVSVKNLFEIQSFKTLHQMTSTIEGEVCKNISLFDLFKALFPCGSITGAPKLRTLSLIQELESRPRGLYTGAIGYLSPENDSCFSVAIRTACLADKILSYGVGSGITWRSQSQKEYEECLLKSEFLLKAFT